jgi:cystathionine beta-lyase/cystathionine gamma-synthase
MRKKWKNKTLLTHDDGLYFKYDGAIVPPIFQNSLFAFKSIDDIDKAFNKPADATIYSRGNNPTVNIVEDKLARIAGAERARLFSSGMAAISAAIMHCVESGDHVIVVKNIYGPAHNFLKDYLSKKFEIEVSFVDGRSILNFEEAIQENTTLFYLESPTSLCFDLQDLAAVSVLANKHDIWTIIDNTWSSPIFQKPLQMGIDFEVHSASKYIGGHSDVVAGLLLGRKEEIDSILLTEQAWFGGKMAPFEAWLLLRSMRTLELRMEAHQKSAMEISSFLENHPKVDHVYFPGLKSHPQHELAQAQMSGFGGLLSFELYSEDLDVIKAFADQLDLFKIGVSWGGHESLVYIPAISYIKELGEKNFKKLGIRIGLIRISIGLEDTGDLIKDLTRALNKA